MSTIVIATGAAAAATGPAMLLVFAAIGIGLGASLYSRIKSQKEDEIAQFVQAMEKKMRGDVTKELARVSGGGENEKLRRELEDLGASIDNQLGSEDKMNRAVDEFNALRLRVRASELDEEQCRVRTDAAAALIKNLHALGLASWEKELDRLEGELEKMSALPAGERLFELQRLTDELREIEKLSDAAADADLNGMQERRVYSPAMESRASIITEIRDWAGRIAVMDETEGEKLRPMLDGLKADTQFPDRLTELCKQLKAKWGTLRERAASTMFFREKLLELMELLKVSENAAGYGEAAGYGKAAGYGEAAELRKRCGTLYGGKFIDRALFMELYEDVARFAWGRAEEIADGFFVQKVEHTLADMGYELLTDDMEDDVKESLSAGRVGYLETPYDGYRVMLKVDGGKVSTRLVRVAEAENEASAPEQKQKDIETGKKWCRDLDGFLEKMRSQNMPLDVMLRKEPEEAELMTVADSDADKANKNARAKKKKRKKAQEADKPREMAIESQ